MPRKNSAQRPRVRTGDEHSAAKLRRQQRIAGKAAKRPHRLTTADRATR